MATAALTLGIVGIFSWIFPPIGFPITIVGLILGAISFLLIRQRKGMALVGAILCFIGLMLNIGVTVGLVTLGLLLEELLPQYYK